jgi:hypothetical protein
MSRISVQAAYPEHHEYNLSGFAIAALRVAPGAIRSWTLALAALLLAAACAHAQAVFGAKAMGIADDGAETIPTATYLGSSTTNSAAPQTILAATVLNSTGDPTPAPIGTVTFFNGTAVVGSGPLDSSDVATVTLNLPAGSYTVTAYYSGDLLHAASTSPVVTVNVSGTGFNLNVNPATVTVAAKQNATVTVTLSSVNGFADAIGLGCASLPGGVTCHFSSISTNLTANETPSQTIHLNIDTNNPLTVGSSTVNTYSGNRGAYLAGLFLPFSLFFGWVFWRFRKRYAAALTRSLVLLLSGVVLLLTGCAEINIGYAAPGTYVIQVTGIAASSGIANYQNVTLNITQ